MLNKEQTIRAWKDPEFRATLENHVGHPAGEISEQELEAIVGGSDTQPQTTVPCLAITFSVFMCSI
ncbi:mersacidin/lichenicidin family type 2 lantibiotic [Thermoflavimicrobium daqui]|uniref:Type 2 lantibiotic n=1 Tax=Thermoflavimicrobium daqui TaxID=2137476 RepID=A0A364K8X6_9BACL|nr:mersacidin/lichenicidin family type 2 lantibiotic [Thermoflavimicrobium daqui]RAL26672.1 type 2 lantibiotic [Thermoflavimicrobium daqui]